VPEFAARRSGFAQAIADAGGRVTEMLLPVHLTTEASYAEIAAFLSANPPPDGIVAASDVIAMSALRALAERGLTVPSDVSVIGYDDIMIAQQTTPPLTTVRQDVARGAALLVDLLFRQMAGDDTEPVAMAPELVLRATA